MKPSRAGVVVALGMFVLVSFGPTGAQAGHPIACAIKVMGVGNSEFAREGGCHCESELFSPGHAHVFAQIWGGSAGNSITGRVDCAPTAGGLACTATIGAPPPPLPPHVGLPPPMPPFDLLSFIPTGGGGVGPASAYCSNGGPLPGPWSMTCGWTYAAGGPLVSSWTVECKFT